MSESLAPDEGGRPVTRLEEEGEIAADYLEELLDIADLGGDIDIDVDHGRAVVAIINEDPTDHELDRLVGHDGEVLDALQELTRIAVQARTGDRSRLMLDIAGYREGRRADLRKVAARAIDEVKEKGINLSLEPMNAFERKVVHDAVAEAGLVSESSGVEPERYVVIRPA
jgi:spoIIIJ-associated protein